MEYDKFSTADQHPIPKDQVRFPRRMLFRCASRKAIRPDHSRIVPFTYFFCASLHRGLAKLLTSDVDSLVKSAFARRTNRRRSPRRS